MENRDEIEKLIQDMERLSDSILQKSRALKDRAIPENEKKREDLPEIECCPFCWCFEVNVYESGEWKFVECEVCGAKGPKFTDEKKALDRWNEISILVQDDKNHNV